MKLKIIFLVFPILLPVVVFSQTDITQAGTDSLIFKNAGVKTMVLSPNGSLRLGSIGAIDASALMQINSTTKGVLIPRMTTSERDAISSPANGLLIYNTTTNEFNFYNGSAWSVFYPTSGYLSGGTAGYVPTWATATSLTSTSPLYASSNKIGINTTSPEGLLHVNDNSNINGLLRITAGTATGTGTTDGFELSINGSSAKVRNYENTSMEFYTANLTRMTITNGGFVGINDVTPPTLLGIRGNTTKAVTSAATNLFSIYSADGSPSHLALQMGVKTDASPSNRYTYIASTDAGSGAHLVLQPTAGRLGIGTLNPNYNVHINNPADAQATLQLTGGTSTGTTNSDGLIIASSSTQAQILNYENTNLSLGSNGSHTMFISGSGNVGIGVSSPSSLLSVGSGNVFTVNNTGDITRIKNVPYVWPNANANGILSNDGSGNLTWSSVGSLGAITTASNGLTKTGSDVQLGGSLTTTTTITQGTNALNFNYTGITSSGFNITANTVTSADAVSITTNGLTTGGSMSIFSNSTAGGASGESILLKLARSGANSNSSHTAIGSNIEVSNSGTSSTNIALRLSASGATNNYALIIPESKGRVGLGISSPLAALHLATSGSSDGILIQSSQNTPGTAGVLGLYRTRGTISAPTAVQNNDLLGEIHFIGENGSGMQTSARILGVATENYTTSATGSKITFETTQNGGTSRQERMVIDNTGNVGIGSTSPSSLLSVGASNQFTVNASGNLTRINNVPYSWPNSNIPGVLNNDGMGNLYWADITSLGSITSASNGLTKVGSDVRLGGTLSTATTIDQGTNTLTLNYGGTTAGGLVYQANSVTSANATSIVANGLTTGRALAISSNSTAGGASAISYLLTLSRSGANSNSNHTAYGISSTVSNTGTSSTNVAGYFAAAGATNNYAIIVPAGGGRVGIGLASPQFPLDVYTNSQQRAVYVVNEVNTSTSPVMGVYGIANGAGSADKNGGYFEAANGTGTNTGLQGVGFNAGGTAIAYGVRGIASGSGTTNIGVYGNAVGATNNYAAIFENGTVGIGTTAPSVLDRLHVQQSSTTNNSTAAYFRHSGAATTGYTLYIEKTGAGATNVGAYIASSGGTNNYALVTPATGGRIGFGTTAPTMRLDVRGSNTKATTANENIFQIASTDATNPLTLRMGLQTHATATSRYASIEVDDAGTKRNLIFQPSGGKVGIGTSTPNSLLGVSGHITLGTGGFSFINANDDVSQLGIFSSLTQYKGAYLLLNSAGFGSDQGSVYLTHGDFTSLAPNSSIFFRYANNGILNNQMTISSNGNVSIGSSITPLERLQIGDRWTFHDGGQKIIYYNAYYDGPAGTTKYIANGAASNIQFGSSGDLIFNTAVSGTAGSNCTFSQRMYLTNNGRLGIGTSSPSFPLDVSGASTATSLTYIWFTTATSLTSSTVAPNVSIRSSNAIWSQGGFYSTSDRRTKKNIVSLDAYSSLQQINNLRPVYYNWIDPTKGTGKEIGLIAQEVESVLPEAVIVQSDFIPDIFQLTNTTIVNDSIIKLNLNGVDLNTGEKIKIVDPKLDAIILEVLQKENEQYNLKLSDKKSSELAEKIFVYGRLVNDYKTIDYDKVFVKGLSAIQQLSKELDELKEAQNQQNLKIIKSLEELKEFYQDLKAENELLKKQRSGNLPASVAKN